MSSDISPARLIFPLAHEVNSNHQFLFFFCRTHGIHLTVVCLTSSFVILYPCRSCYLDSCVAVLPLAYAYEYVPPAVCSWLTLWASLQICSLITAQSVLVIRLCAICMIFSIIWLTGTYFHTRWESESRKRAWTSIWSDTLMIDLNADRSARGFL